ncbi:hypothetical protein [Streptomyces sp. NPDC051677]|uniref:hypothetical protein n=1 Tax=Streptomyces sp. NPDC051677 TaxID=3365669 RepID=UPI0037D67262
MTTRTKITGVVLGAAVAGALALVPLTDDGPDPGPGPGPGHDTAGAGAGGNVVLGESEKEAVPSFTATDWVSHGDQVAVVRVTAERELRDASRADTGDDSGEDYLARTVDLRVGQRLWARSGAPALPVTVSVTADGWQLKDGAKREVGSRASSRLEVGHDYVVAFGHFSDGAWAPLGSGAVLPCDGGRIGDGEFQGETVTVDAYRSALEQRLVPGDEEPVAYRAVGKPAAGVQGILRGAKPTDG